MVPSQIVSAATATFPHLSEPPPPQPPAPMLLRLKRASIPQTDSTFYKRWNHLRRMFGGSNNPILKYFVRNRAQKRERRQIRTDIDRQRYYYDNNNNNNAVRYYINANRNNNNYLRPGINNNDYYAGYYNNNRGGGIERQFDTGGRTGGFLRRPQRPPPNNNNNRVATITKRFRPTAAFS